MAIVAKGVQGDFEIAPAGLYPAIVSGIKDLGVLSGDFGEHHKIRVFFQLDDRGPSGRRFSVHNIYTLSLHPKSKLTEMVIVLLGRELTDKEKLEGLDLESLIGKCCQAQIFHKAGKTGAIFPNIKALHPAPKGFSMELEEYHSVDAETPF